MKLSKQINCRKTKKFKEIMPFTIYPFTLKPQHSFPHIRYALRFCITGNLILFEASFLVGIIADFSDFIDLHLY